MAHGGDPVEQDDRTGSMTLVFTLPALDRLADPEQVLGGSLAWAEHVSVVATDPREVLRFTRAHDVPQEYFASTPGGDRRERLGLLDETTATDRYVLIGGDGADERLADDLGWEYLPAGTAAEKAGWTLRGGDDGAADDGVTADDGGVPGDGDAPEGRLRRLVTALRDRWSS